MASAQLPVNPGSTATLRLMGTRLTLARIVWILVAAVSALLFIADIPVFAQDIHASSQIVYGSTFDAGQVMAIAIWHVVRRTLTYTVIWLVGAVIFWRRSDNPVALIISSGLICAGFNLMLIAASYREPGNLFSQDLVSFVATCIGYLGLLFEVGLFFILPSGTFVPFWTRWLFLLWAVGLAVVFIVVPAEAVADLVNYGFLVFFMPGIYAQFYRYRHISDPLQRQQTKWLVIGALIAGVVGSVYHVLIPAMFWPAIESNIMLRVFYSLGLGTLWNLCLLAVPISFMVAVLRYRLWGVDIVVNRSLVYGLLTVILALVYFGIIILLQAGLEMVLGGERSSIAIAASTLVIAGLFQPVRRQVQTAIDHRFPNPIAHFKPLAAPTITIPASSLSGVQFGVYEVEQSVGQGGMAEIYKGRHTSLNREVAIKVLHSTFTSSPEFRARFEREAQTVAALRHPNIVQVFDFGVQDDRHYMVMEYINGPDLSHYLREYGNLTLDAALPLITEVASALDYAHDLGLVHRDVKPSNVMLQPATETHISFSSALGYRAILTDFGVAKLISDTADLTKTGIVGTLDYLAPEQIMAPKEIDRRADIYALGAMVYEILTGQTPFKDENYGIVLYAHLQQPPPDIRAKIPDMPEHVAVAIKRALAKDRSERFSTAGDFVESLHLRRAEA